MKEGSEPPDCFTSWTHWMYLHVRNVHIRQSFCSVLTFSLSFSFSYTLTYTWVKLLNYLHYNKRMRLRNTVIHKITSRTVVRLDCWDVYRQLEWDAFTFLHQSLSLSILFDPPVTDRWPSPSFPFFLLRGRDEGRWDLVDFVMFRGLGMIIWGQGRGGGWTKVLPLL